VDILGRVKPNISRQCGREHVLARSHALHADALSLQIGNAVDAFVSKQFEAADVHPGDHHHVRSAVDPNDEGRRERHGEIGVAARDGVDGGSTRRDQTHIADVGEALST